MSGEQHNEKKVGFSGANKKNKKNIRVVGRRRRFDKGAEDTVAVLARLLDAVSKRDHVERDVVLLELLGEADERALGVGRGVLEWGADKDDDALAQVLVLPVLERELRDRDRRRDGRRLAEVGGRLVHGGKDLTELFGVRDEHLGAGNLNFFFFFGWES